jgi:hypothetical protein
MKSFIIEFGYSFVNTMYGSDRNRQINYICLSNKYNCFFYLCICAGISDITIEHISFVPCHDLGAMDDRLNLPAVRDVLMATLQSVADRSVSPEEALLRIRRWLNSGHAQVVEVELTHQYQFA